MTALTDALTPFVFDPPPRAFIGRPKRDAIPPRTTLERVRKHRATKGATRIQDVAVLDFETDKFDRTKPKERIVPFVACLYSDQFEPIVIWEDNEDEFITAVLGAIERLPRRYTIYAHNGGKFDYMLLLRRLRGTVKFKGRAIMSARVGKHELRDSLHIIPTRLAEINKDDFDYSMLDRPVRHRNRAAIIKYLISDCANLFPIIRKFVDEHGLKVSIGQAATALLRKRYTIGRLSERVDYSLRPYFFGGRVECFMGAGHFVAGPRGPYKLFDVNSMYPWAMATHKHPTGTEYLFRGGQPSPYTYFIDLECVSHGALVHRVGQDVCAAYGRGRFQTTIWEYNAARELDLLEDVEIIKCVDCLQSSDFADFINPIYERRLITKAELDRLKGLGMKHTEAYQITGRDDLISKFLLNNSWGKQAQNPRRFKEYYITDPNEAPPFDRKKPWPEFAAYECDEYWIWERPAPGVRFNNVGTGASITGAARAEFMRAAYHAVDPIYGDTDGIICRDLPGFEIHKTKLGAWDIEDEYSEVLIAGKKKYAAKPVGYVDGGREKLKFRWAGASDLTWADVEQTLMDNIIPNVARAPTLTRDGRQFYMTRNLKRTAPIISDQSTHPFRRAVA